MGGKGGCGHAIRCGGNIRGGHEGRPYVDHISIRYRVGVALVAAPDIVIIRIILMRRCDFWKHRTGLFLRFYHVLYGRKIRGGHKGRPYVDNISIRYRVGAALVAAPDIVAAQDRTVYVRPGYRASHLSHKPLVL